MGSTATVIDLSFVVIGFLFDVVKDKTQRTLEELFRATGLYQVFSISVISLVAIVIINCFKYTASNYIACNFAVLSSLFLKIKKGRNHSDISQNIFEIQKVLKLDSKLVVSHP